jgi:hypothetical protein
MRGLSVSAYLNSFFPVSGFTSSGGVSSRARDRSGNPFSRSEADAKKIEADSPVPSHQGRVCALTPRILFFTLFFLLAGTFLFPQDWEESGENLTLKIAVIGPGDELYFWWGHIGLIIEDRRDNTSRFYDYGIFSFENENFFLNFAFGRLLYSCGVSSTENNFAVYRKTNRDILVYTLDVPPEKREEVRRFAERNVLPENRDYFYHHFKDNCATRIRDIIDLAVDGQFLESFVEAPGRLTLREHVRRHTWHDTFMDWILNFWMGQNIDEPITVWEEMFLPSEIGRRIEEFSYTDSSGAGRRLVNSVELLHAAEGRPPVLEKPQQQWTRELGIGLLTGALLFGFALLARAGIPGGRVLFGLGQSLTGLFFGVAGSLLFFLSFFTNHDYSWHNSNILYVNPLLLAGVPLGFLYAFGGEGKRRVSELLPRILWMSVIFGCLFTMVIKLFPGFCQQNQVTQALMLPIALALTFAPRRR